MEHNEGTFKNTKGIDIYYQCWLPKDEPKAVLLIVHGLGEHCGRYMNLVNYFVPEGYAIYAYDHQGHGRSGGEPEVIECFDDYTDALSVFHKMVSGWHLRMPFFLIGHSMGGLIAAYYLLENQSMFKGAVLSSPLLKITASRLIIHIGKILSKLAPKVGIMKADPSWVSRDQEVVGKYVNDPLVFHGKTPARLATELLRIALYIEKVSDRITLPILIAQAEADRLVNPQGAQIFYDNVRSEDKTLKIYQGLYHELFNEPEKDRVIRDVGVWLKQQERGEKRAKSTEHRAKSKRVQAKGGEKGSVMLIKWRLGRE